MMKKIFLHTYVRNIIFGIFFIIPFLFAGHAKATTPFSSWADYTVPMTSCGEITMPGTYTIDPSFDNDSLDGSGNCFVILANDVVIDGGISGYNITGNINGNGNTPGISGFNYTINNLHVSGTVSSTGITGDNDNSGSNGGILTILNSTAGNVSTAGAGPGGSNCGAGAGGSVSVSSSTIGEINASGARSCEGGQYGSGSVTIENSTTTNIISTDGTVTVATSTVGNINVDGGEGCSSCGQYWGQSGGTVTVSNSKAGDISATGGNGVREAGAGGPGGTINIWSPSVFGALNVDPGSVGPSGGENSSPGFIYLDGVQQVTSCQTFSSPGTYSLIKNIGSGGSCIIVTTNGVIINGQGKYTIDGDVTSPDTSAQDAANIYLENVTVTGVITAGNQTNTGDVQGGSGGGVTIINSTTTTITSGSTGQGSGGNITITNSTSTSITSGNGGSGGNAGNITYTNSTSTSITSGNGGDANVYGGGHTGGKGGDVIIVTNNSTPTVIDSCETITASGTYTLSHNIGTGGDCLFINSSDVVIDGGNNTINGNVNGNGIDIAGQGYSYELHNTHVTGTISSNGRSTTSTVTRSMVLPSLPSITFGIGGFNSDGGNQLNTHRAENGQLYVDTTAIGTIINSCKTITDSGTYVLTQDIGSSGDCLIINANDVTINGKGHVVNGNINGNSITIADSNPAAASGYNYTIEDIAVLGNVTSMGGNDNNNWCGTGGNGGSITIGSSTVGNVNVNGGEGYNYYGCNPAGGAGGTINIVSPSDTGTLYFAAGGPGSGGQVGQFTGYMGNNSNDYGSNILNGGNGGVITETGDSINLASSTFSATGGSGGLGGLNGTVSVGTVSSAFTSIVHTNAFLSALAHFKIYGTGGANLGDTGSFPGGAFPTLPGDIITDSSQCTFIYPGTYYVGATITGNCSVNSDGVVIDGRGQYTINGNISGDVTNGIGHYFTVQNITVTGNITSIGSGALGPNYSGSLIISTSTVNTVSVNGNTTSYNGGNVTLNNSTANSISANGEHVSIYARGGRIALTNSTSTSITADVSAGAVNTGATAGNIILTNSNATNISASGGVSAIAGTVTITSSSINISNSNIVVSGGGTNGTATFNFTTINHAGATLSALNHFRINGPSNVGQNLGDTGSFVAGSFPTLPGETVTTSAQCSFNFVGTYKLGADIAGCAVHHNDVVIDAQNYTISKYTGQQYALAGNSKNFSLQNATTTGTVLSPGSTITIATSTIDTINVDSTTGGNVTLTNSHVNIISAKGTAGAGGSVTMNGAPNLRIASTTVDTHGTTGNGTININFANVATDVNTFFYNVNDLVVNGLSAGTWNGVYNPTIYYFNSEVAGAGNDGDWNNPLNWWYDSSFTAPYGSIPDGASIARIYSDISTNTGSSPANIYSLTFYGTSTNNITINANHGAIFNDASLNASGGHIIGQTILNNGGLNAGIITGVTTFNATSSNIGTVINNATTTFNGNLSSSTGLVTDTNGATSTPIVRIFTQAVSTTRNFLTEAGHNNWVLVAQGVAVNITNAVYSTATNVFRALFGGYFITGGASVTPQIAIHSPASGTNNKWLPSVSWDTSTSCAYSYDDFATVHALDCAKNGSDIPRPTDIRTDLTLYLQGIDPLGNETQTSGLTFQYDNSRPIYTLCGTDLLDEVTRPYYYLQGNVAGDCKATVSTELHGNISNLTTGYTVSGNIIATTTGDAVSVTLRNITVGGDVHAEGIADGANGATTTILFSNIGNVFTSGATSTVGKGGNSGSVNISYSTTTSIVANAGQSVGASYGTVGDIIIGKSKILGPILASGNTNGGSAGLISIATSTTYAIVANGGNGSAKGGNGGTINITSTLGVASSTISVNGGDATVCGRGGNSGVVTLSRSSYGRISVNAGSDFSGQCPAYTNGSSGTGGDTHIVNDGGGYTSPDAGAGAGGDQNQQTTGGSSVGSGGIFNILPPVAVIRPLNLKPLPVFGETTGAGNGDNSFSFITNLTNYLFKLIPSTGDKTLDAYLASRGLIHEQDLVALRTKPILNNGSAPGIFSVFTTIMPVKSDTSFTTTTTAPLTTYLSSIKPTSLTETVTAFSGSTLTISFIPIGKAKVAGTFNNAPVTLVKSGKTLTTTITLPSTPGTYTFTTPQSPLPLTIIIPRPKIVAQQPAPTPSFWSILRNIF